MVADRYHLDRFGRAVLFRGVFRKKVNEKRKARVLQGSLPGSSILKVDTLNQLYCIGSYLSGQLVFISSDGFLRDASGFHGEPLERRILDHSVQSMISFLGETQNLTVVFFLDTQADSSRSVLEAITPALKGGSVKMEVVESDRVDAILSEGKGFIPATSDSTIIDRSENAVFDLARHVLEKEFSAKIPDIPEILSLID